MYCSICLNNNLVIFAFRLRDGVGSLVRQGLNSLVLAIYENRD